MLNNDVTNSADFATILSVNAVGNGPYGQAQRGGHFSANPKDVEAIRHEFGHNFGGYHYVKNPSRYQGYAVGYFADVGGSSFGTALGGNNINYYSNPRINHPELGVPLGRHNTHDMARYITERRFSLNRGDESRACYTCNAYSGQRLHITCRCATGEIDHNFQEAVIYKMNKNFLLPISLLVCATLYSYNVRNKI